jgi:hypothetical protein
MEVTNEEKVQFGKTEDCGQPSIKTAGQYDLYLHNPVFFEGGEVSGGKAEDGS